MAIMVTATKLVRLETQMRRSASRKKYATVLEGICASNSLLMNPHPPLRGTLSQRERDLAVARAPSPAGRGWPEGPGEGRRSKHQLQLTKTDSLRDGGFSAAAIFSSTILP